MTPEAPDKPPWRWRVFWISAAITFAICAVLAAWNPLGLFDSL